MAPPRPQSTRGPGLSPVQLPQGWHTGWDPCSGQEVKNDLEPRLQTWPVHGWPNTQRPCELQDPHYTEAAGGQAYRVAPGPQLAVSFPHFGPVTLCQLGCGPQLPPD